MNMVIQMARSVRVGLMMSVLGAAVAGCGVVYTPQEFEKNTFTYGYKGDFDVAIDVVPLTFSSARAANSDGYVPRTLPDAFSDAPASPDMNVPARERMTAAGVYDIVPALVFDPPPASIPYDGGREVVPPAVRNETLQPLPVPEPLYLPLPESPYDVILEPQASSSLPSPVSAPVNAYVSGSQAVPYTVVGQPPAVLQVQGASSVSAPARSFGTGFVSNVARMGRQAPSFSSDVDLDVLLERPQLRQPANYNPLPYTAPTPYRIGPGDAIGLQIQSNALPSLNGSSETAIVPEKTGQRLLVQDSGDIFVPQVGTISVGGLTLPEARRVINDRLVASGLGFDPGVQIVKFGSKNISISGLNDAKLIPISVRPVTLGEAVVSVGGLGPKPEDAVVRVLRDGAIYEMSGDRILASGTLAGRLLIDGDLVAVTSGYDPQSAISYFDQQLQLREVTRSNFIDDLARAREERAQEAAELAIAEFEFNRRRLNIEDERAQRAERRAEEQFEFDRERFERQRERFDVENERFATAEQRAQAAERRAGAGELMDRTRLSLNLRSARLETDRLRREAEIARLQAQRATGQVNEEARIANIEARQSYLNQLRALEQLNRETLSQIRQENREIRGSNQAERVRSRTDRLAVMEMELRQERVRLEALSGQRQEARTLFNNRMQLGAIERDYITIAGEARNQITMPLPFDGRLTLTRALYEKTNGLDPLSSDTSEIYVIRTPPQDKIQRKVIAFHLNASNPAALAVASIFEMRPNDVVYVNPQTITKWNRVLTQILPSTGLVQSGLSAVSGVGN